jgi:hypothetical protein
VSERTTFAATTGRSCQGSEYGGGGAAGVGVAALAAGVLAATAGVGVAGSACLACTVGAEPATTSAATNPSPIHCGHFLFFEITGASLQV